MLTLEEISKKAFIKEDQGNYREAANILEESMKSYPNLYIDLLYEQAMLYFRNEEYYTALIKLIEVYQLYKSEDILEFIFESYVYPNQNEYRENYYNNIKLLDNYQLIYNASLPHKYEDIQLKLVWCDDKAIIYYIDGIFIQNQCKEHIISEELKDVLIIIDAFCIENILDIEEKNKEVLIYIADDLLFMNPLYLYYERLEFITFLCFNNIEPILKRERVVFLIEKESVESYFQNLYTILPERIIYFGKHDINVIKEVVEKRKEISNYLHTEGKTRIMEYYNKNEKLIIERVKSAQPKILFITTRYTTALQYHAKNLYHAAVRKGLDVRLQIEKNCVDVLTKDVLLQEIEQFKPDIIVSLNHFRFEMIFSDLCNAMISLVWIQDPMPIIMDKTTPKKLVENDFILNHYISWKDFFDIGYDENKMISAPIPGNQDIYKPYELSEEEKSKYSCDICIVSHYSVIYSYIENEMSLYEDKSKEIIKNMYLTYYHKVLDEEKICYSKEQFDEFIRQYFIEQHNIIMEEDIVEHLTDKMYTEFGGKVYRQAMVKWILGAGYKNIKLWGYGWEEENDFAAYAMGAAENGEKLSKILQASKIVIGNNYACTSAARVWETMLSGGFYLSNYVPEECDAIDIRMILEEDDYVMFKSKAELLEKIDYYLNHEKERVEMAQKGRERALQKMTFDVLMDRILKQLNEKL